MEGYLKWIAAKGGRGVARNRIDRAPVFPAAKRDRTIVRVALGGQGPRGAADGASHVDSFLADCRGGRFQFLNSATIDFRVAKATSRLGASFPPDHRGASRIRAPHCMFA
jgi:hypothetical protein